MELSADHGGTEVQTRRFARVPFFAPVRLMRLATNQVLELQASNLSRSGIFVETVIPFAPGELFRLVFPSAPGGVEEVAVARIAWRRPFTSARGTGAQPGIGIQFVMMQAADREAIERLIEEGGIAAPPAPRSVASRAPSQPRVLVFDRPEPPERFALTGGGIVQQGSMDVGPMGWLLVAALAAAAAASLLLGLQPMPG